MNQWGERLKVAANPTAMAGIVFPAVEIHQNTQAIRAQTRDAVTTKQMEYYRWVATRGWRELWALVRLAFAPDFRDDIDRIVAEVQSEGEP